MKVYTKTGDQGLTSLYDGSRVKKSEEIFDVLGSIDELSAHIGRLYYLYKRSCEYYNGLKDIKILDFIFHVQKKLLQIGSVIATPNPPEGCTLPQLNDEDVKDIEKQIDEMDKKLHPLTVFIIQAANNESEAEAHICRAVARRVERQYVKVFDAPDLHLQYFNRLSDFFFTFARYNGEKWK
jgi:cob(I)alamin adenosyltransferase